MKEGDVPMDKGYTYEPDKIQENGKDRMRFELGDTMVEGGAETTALTDEEIQAALSMHPGRWKRAKLALLESICRRFAYEPDMKNGPLSFSLAERAKLWREDYESLKKEVGSVCVPRLGSGSEERQEPPYFYSGMMSTEESEGRGK